MQPAAERKLSVPRTNRERVRDIKRGASDGLYFAGIASLLFLVSITLRDEVPSDLPSPLAIIAFFWIVGPLCGAATGLLLPLTKNALLAPIVGFVVAWPVSLAVAIAATWPQIHLSLDFLLLVTMVAGIWGSIAAWSLRYTLGDGKQ